MSSSQYPIFNERQGISNQHVTVLAKDNQLHVCSVSEWVKNISPALSVHAWEKIKLQRSAHANADFMLSWYLLVLSLCDWFN